MENKQLIENAINYIRENACDSSLSIDGVAKNAGFSMDYFNRLFLAETGFNVMEYVRHERLQQAARRLPKYPRIKILDLALEYGYQSHESFTRAFKNQYGLTPQEFRERCWKDTLLTADIQTNVFANRLIKEFPHFKVADIHQTIDYLLEKDPIRYAHDVVSMRASGGAILYDGKDLSEGFIWFMETSTTQVGAILFSNNYDKIASYLTQFSAPRFTIFFYSSDDSESIVKNLRHRCIPVKEIYREHHRVCKYPLQSPTPPDGLSMRLLTWEDRDKITTFLMSQKVHYPHIQAHNYSLNKRDVQNLKECYIYTIGIFRDEKLCGTVHTNIYTAHGLKCSSNQLFRLEENLRKPEVYDWAFCEATNLILNDDAIAFDSVHSLDGITRVVTQNFGYEVVADLIKPLFSTGEQVTFSV